MNVCRSCPLSERSCLYEIQNRKKHCAGDAGSPTVFPKAVLGIVFNSRVYQLGEYLRHAEHSMKGLIGYDLLKANVDLLKSGDVHYLIGQRPGLQGYCGVKALCDHVVFKKSVDSVKYMPIDILIKENIDFYFEFV